MNYSDHIIDQDEALLIALNDSLLTNESTGDELNPPQTELLWADDGTKLYKFVFEPGDDPGRAGKTVTVVVAENGSVYYHSVFAGAMITPVLPGMSVGSLSEDAKESNILFKKMHLLSYAKDSDLEVRLEFFESNSEYSDFYFVAEADFLKEAASLKETENYPPDPHPVGKIISCEKSYVNFSSVYDYKWDNKAVGFNIRGKPLQIDFSSCTIKIDSLFGREGNWSFEVF